MLESNRLVPFIFTFLPALVYAIIIYMTAPYGKIGRRMAQLYFQMGLVSAMVTSWFLWVFPEWQSPLSDDPTTSVALLSFMQIAFLEEGMKFAMFKATEQYRIKKTDPAAVMFYCMCVSSGFAVMENVMYLQMYGSDVLIVRAFSAIILHMVTGLMMGYFMSLRRSYLTEFFAVSTPVFFHGLYDFNIMMGDFGHGYPISMVLAPGVLITFYMWKKLVAR